MLTLDEDRQITTATCSCCGRERTTVTGFVYRDEDAHAIYYASCYPHDGEAWISVILGTWGEDIDTHDDHVTFGCRVPPKSGGCMLVPAASAYNDSPMFGQKLNREEALAHPWLSDFWAVVDHVLVNDPLVHRHVYGAP